MLEEHQGVVIHIPFFLFLSLADTVIVNILILQNTPFCQKVDKSSRLCGKLVFLLLVKRSVCAVLVFTHGDSPFSVLSLQAQGPRM